MVYSNKFVMCVLVNGQPQQELANGQVSLPFGTEYHLRFRNKNNRRAVVQFFIDGENVSGNGYIVPANDYVDIKRHHDKDRAFKFVSLDSPDAVDAGKNGPNDDKTKGVIEARFSLEKEYKPVYYPPVVEEHHHHHHHYPRPRPPIYPYNPPPIWFGTGDTRGDSIKYTCKGPSGQSVGLSSCDSVPVSNNLSCDAPAHESVPCSTLGFAGQKRNRSTKELKDGCTVEGMTTNQSFTTSWINTEESFTSIKLFLVGFQPEPQAVTPEGPQVVLNDTTQPTEEKYCDNCGSKKKKKAKFCANCGHKLV